MICKHGFNERTLEQAWLVSGSNTAQFSGYGLTMTGLGPSVGRPYGPTARVLQEGDLLCYDVGSATSGYHSDSARTYVLGAPDSRQRDAWAVLAGHLERGLVGRRGQVGAKDIGEQRSVTGVGLLARLPVTGNGRQPAG